MKLGRLSVFVLSCALVLATIVLVVPETEGETWTPLPRLVNNDLKCGMYVDPNFYSTIVDDQGSVGLYTSIALDSDDYPRVTYYDESSQNLKYAYMTENGWYVFPIAIDQRPDRGKYSSLVIDSGDTVHVSYYDATDGNLRYLKLYHSMNVVDEEGDVGSHTSMAIESGSPYLHISYYDETNQRLKYARGLLGNWDVGVVDVGNVGQYTSIALDSNNNPHISYYDEASGNLKYAKWTGTSSSTCQDNWECESVDTDTDVGKFTSIALDDSDAPHISYYDVDSGNLKYAKWTGAPSLTCEDDWECDSVDTDTDVGKYTSIALDNSYNPYISYYDIDNADLKLAKWTGSPSGTCLDNWECDSLDTGGDVGKHTSLVIDFSNTPQVSYAAQGSIEMVNPAIATGCDRNNNCEYVHVVWLDQRFVSMNPYDRIYYRRSSDSGLTWDIQYKPISILMEPGDGWSEPSIYVEGETIHVAWARPRPLTGEPPGYIFYQQSTDNGETWLSNEIQVDDPGPTGTAIPMGSSPSVFATADRVHIAWKDMRGVQYDSAFIAEASDPDKWGSNYGEHSSIAVSPTGLPFVSYYDSTFANLMISASSSGGIMASGIFDTQTVDSQGIVGKYSSIALDDKNYPFPHISYVDETGTVGQHTSIAMDSDDDPHISYYDEVNLDLKYASWETDHWDIATLDWSGDVGKYTSIILDANDYRYISYYDATIGALKSARWTGDSQDPWILDVIDDGGVTGDNVGQHTSIALDSDEDPHVTYYDASNGDLKLAYWTETGWYVFPIAIDQRDDRGKYSSLAIDSDDTLHISYYDATYGDLRYQRWGINPRMIAVDEGSDVGKHTSIALDESGPGAIVHISYYDETNQKLKHATGAYEDWDVSIVDEGNVGLYTSIALDSSNNLHISYYDASSDDLKHAEWTGISSSTCQNNWDCEPVDTGGVVGEYTSIIFGSDNIPHISYYDATFDGLKHAKLVGGSWILESVEDTKRDLKYAKWNGNEWEISTVDGDGDVGKYSSIALDSYNYPHISYYDATNTALLYVRWDGNQWLPATGQRIVDNNADVGKFTSIALDDGDSPHISYYDADSGNLKYAIWTGFPSLTCEDDWECNPVDSAGDVGMYTSIALDSSYDPHISYYDADGGNLKYAIWTGSPSLTCEDDWECEPVDTGGIVGEYTSIALDDSDDPHISYYDETYGDLKYAKWTGSPSGTCEDNWECDSVDTDDDVGQYTSIAFGVYGAVHISYYDETNRQLKYYSWPSTFDNGVVQRDEILSYPWWGVSRERYTTAITPGIAGDDQFVHVTYTESTGLVGDLRYATRPGLVPGSCGTTWECEPVDTVGNVGLYTSIVVDANDIPHISYYDETNGLLKYATPDGLGGWDIQIPDPDSGNVGLWTSIDLDSNGYPHISYRSLFGGYLKWAWKDGSGWHSKEVCKPTWGCALGMYNSLVLDQNDIPHISYYDFVEPKIRHAYYDPVNDWFEFELVNEYGWLQNSIAIDSSQNLHVSHGFHFYSVNGLAHADNEFGWDYTTVDIDDYVGLYNSIEMTPVKRSDDRVRISYQDVTNGNLKYARSKGSWTDYELTDVDDSPDRVGRWTSLAAHSKTQGQWEHSLGISYYDETNGNLKYASCVDSPLFQCDATGKWNIEIVDETGYVGLYTSVDFEQSGAVPHVSYYDESGGRAIFHTRSLSVGGEVWSSETQVSEKLTEVYQWPNNPEVDVSGENVHVVWNDNRDDDTMGHEVYYQKSPDAGETWPGPGTDVRISDGVLDPNQDDILPKLSASGATLNVVWQKDDFAVGYHQVMYDYNTVNGDSGGWGPDQIIAPDPLPTPPYYAMTPDISAIGNDRHVVWVYGTGMGLELYYAHRIDEISEVAMDTLISKEGASSVYVSPIPGENWVFVIGGDTATELSDQVVRVDPDTGLASVFCTFSTGVADTSAVWPGGNTIYAFGGRTSSGAVNTIWKIDLTVQSCGTISETLDANKYGTSAVFDGTQYAYIFGGYDGTSYFNKILEFDVFGEQITPHSAILGSERAFTSAVWDYTHGPGKAFIFGGETDTDPYVGTITEFDPNDIGSEVEEYVNAALFPSRAKTAAIFDGRYAYIIGGSSADGSLDEIVRFNTNGDWTEGVQLMCMPLPDELEGLSAVVSTATLRGADNGIFIIGGKSDTVYKDKVWKYYPSYWEP